MVLFIILLVVLAVLALLAFLLFDVAWAAVVILFGDLIVFVCIIALIIKLIRKMRKR